MHAPLAAACRPLPVPEAILGSELMRQGGYLSFNHHPDAATCRRLLAEARRCVRGAVASSVFMSDGQEGRGGEPARRFISAGGGEAQAAVYHDPATSRLLARLCGAPVRPAGEQGTYTYYARPGDHLDLHRDIEVCDVAVVTCLLDRHRPGSSGGLTRLYPGRHQEPLSRIRATPDDGARSVRLPVGHTMVMFGGIVPHLIQPIGPGELRIVSILCFTVEAS